MASPPAPSAIKQETIRITLNNGKGAILVMRPGKNGQNIGQLNQFEYEGNAAMKILDALAVARRQLEEKLAAAKTAPAVKSVTTTPAVVIDPDEGDASLPVVPDDEEGAEEGAEEAEDTADAAPEAEPEANEPAPHPADTAAAAYYNAPQTVSIGALIGLPIAAGPAAQATLF